MGRRAFLRLAISAAGVAGAGVVAGRGAEGGSDRHGPVLPARRFGRAEERITALCVGGAHVHSAMDRPGAERLIEAAIAEGVRFFETAESYGAGESETRFGLYLCPRYRDEIFLMTKSRARTADEARRHLEGSLRRMRTDRLDLWQMHALESPEDADRRIEAGVLDVFLEAKASGKARYIGFTGHARYSAMLRMLERLDGLGVRMDACQMPVNVVDPGYESFIVNVMPPLIERGYAVLAMKTLVYGQLFGRRTSWNWARPGGPAESVVGGRMTLAEALGFAWSLPAASLVIGMATPDEVRENARLCRTFPRLDEKARRELVERAADCAGPEMEFYKA